MLIINPFTAISLYKKIPALKPLVTTALRLITIPTNKGWQFRRVIVLILGVLLVLCMLRHCTGKRAGAGWKSKGIIASDTLWLKPDTVVLFDTVFPPPEIRWRTLAPPAPEVVEKIVVVRDTVYINAYTDSVVTDSINIYYALKTRGELITIDLGWKLNFPIVNTNTTVTEKQRVTNKVYTNGLFLVAATGGSKDEFQFGIGATFVSRRLWLAGYKYFPIQRAHVIEGGVRLWGKRK